MSGFQRPLLLFISHAISVSSKHRNKHQLSHSSLRAILLPLLLLLSQQAQHTEHDPHHWLNTQSTTHTAGSTHRARPKPLAQHTEHDPHHWLKTQSTPHTTGSTHRARLTPLAQREAARSLCLTLTHRLILTHTRTSSSSSTKCSAMRAMLPLTFIMSFRIRWPSTVKLVRRTPVQYTLLGRYIKYVK